MADVEILQPLLNGIKNSSYTDGQVLTAQHLRTDQEANRAQHRQLGIALGAGVARGLTVGIVSPSATKPVLSVSDGLAINRKGELLCVPESTNVTLLQNASETTDKSNAGLFAQCAQQQTPLTTKGLYLLTVKPASSYEGRVEMTSLVADSTTTTCGRKFAVEGVQFRIVPVDLGTDTAVRTQMAALTSLSGTQPPQLHVLRSGVAHILYGTDRIGTKFTTDPFDVADSVDRFATYGRVDEMRAAGLLTACEVPLAVLYWTALGIQFVDMWAVRRRLTPPNTGDPWPLVSDARRVHESRAMLLQFQDQLETLRNLSGLASVTAKTHFRFLPAAGFVPIAGPLAISDPNFWTGLNVERVNLDRAFVRSVVHESFYVDPIDLSAPPPLKLYIVEDKPDYLLFFRDDVLPTPAPGPAAPADEPQPEVVDPGNILATLVVDDSKVIELLAGLRPGDVKITAEGGGKTFTGKLLNKGKSGRDPFPKNTKFEIQYLFSKLPPGRYTVRLSISKVRTASQQTKVESNKTAKLTFHLKPDPVKPGKPGTPPRGFGLKDPWFEKGYVLDKYLKWPWPPEEILKTPIEEINPDPGWVDPIRDLAEDIARKYPEAPVDPGAMHVYRNKDHSPSEAAEEPYAWLAFDNGAYAPMVLVPNGKGLGTSVPVTRVGVGGLDDSTHGASLREAGIRDLDAFAYAWSGLIEDTLDVTANTAKAMLGEGRKQAAAVENSLFLFAGVDKTLDAAMGAAGIKTPADLANSNAEALVRALGEDKISTAMAQRLVDDARKAVPAAQWSLGSVEVGLNKEQLRKLEQQGIFTLGDLEKAKQADVAKAVNVTGAQAGTMIQRGKSAREGAFKVRKEGAPVTEVLGVNVASGLGLRALGVDNVNQLAGAKAEVIVGAFGGNLEAAKGVIVEAQNFLKI